MTVLGLILAGLFLFIVFRIGFNDPYAALEEARRLKDLTGRHHNDPSVDP